MVSLRESFSKFSLRLFVLITDMEFVLKRFSQHVPFAFFFHKITAFCDNQDCMNILSKCQLNGAVFENLFEKSF